MRIGIIGGDVRMLYAAKAFENEGAEVIVSAVDGADGMIISPAEAAARSDILVLPVKPLSAGGSDIAEVGGAAGSKPVFSGDGERVREYFKGNVYDYSQREEFCVYNAVLTAEGAVEIALREYKGSLFDSRVLVLGYGRIGRALSRILTAMGARLTAAVRSESAKAWAGAEGINTCDYSLRELNTYDIIFNTVPAPVLPSSMVDRISADALVIDLASMPGGVDFKRAVDRGIRAIHALGLPGKTAPIAAGRITAQTIINIIKEENGGKDHSGLCDDRLLLHL